MGKVRLGMVRLGKVSVGKLIFVNVKSGGCQVITIVRLEVKTPSTSKNFRDSS